ncbi:hypothetical protein Hanom_Chr09g00866301 [Helianthus anomalus]
MGFVMGISTFSSSSQPHFFYSHHRKPHEFGKRRRIYACMQHHDPNDDVFCHRRAFLFMGVAVLPFLNLKARAFENLAPDESGMFDFELFFNVLSLFFTFLPNLFENVTRVCVF